MFSERVELIEFCSDASLRAAADPHSVHDDPMSVFVDRALRPDWFCFIAIPGRRRFFLSRLLGQAEESPKVIRDIGGAIDKHQNLLNLARRGFSLVVGTLADVEETTRFLGGLGYRNSGASRLAHAITPDLLRASWERESLVAAVRAAMEIPFTTLFFFGHDGDPIYLLRRCRAQDQFVRGVIGEDEMT